MTQRLALLSFCSMEPITLVRPDCAKHHWAYACFIGLLLVLSALASWHRWNAGSAMNLLFTVYFHTSSTLQSTLWMQYDTQSSVFLPLLSWTMANLFFARGTLSHRPWRGSCPTAATQNLPPGPIAMSFMWPCIGIASRALIPASLSSVLTCIRN